MCLKKVLFYLLVLFVAVNCSGQSRLRRQIMEFEEKAKETGALTKIYPICAKGRETGNTLMVELYFKQKGAFENNDIAVIDLAVAAWGNILDFDSTYKKIMVKIEIEKTIRLERCFTIVNEYQIGFCSELVVTDLTGCLDGLSMATHFFTRPI
jgi:hypothetical protein